MLEVIVFEPRPESAAFDVADLRAKLQERPECAPDPHDPDTLLVDLDVLGFFPEQRQVWDAFLRRPHGIVLLTGPTGSGKTTTLYSSLKALAGPEVNITTIEDPIEMITEAFNQVQVDPRVEVTFSSALRTVLRQDPDIIMVGEIRDFETAEIAVKAALTGHMVLSTLHTNDVPSTFVRLVDMGVEPYLVNAAVEGISAQRLLRRLCPGCHNRDDQREACATCAGIGYRGRVAVMEFAGVTPRVKRIMLEGAEEHRLRDALQASGYVPMRTEAARLIADHITDEAEVARVLGAHVTDLPDARGDA